MVTCDPAAASERCSVVTTKMPISPISAYVATVGDGEAVLGRDDKDTDLGVIVDLRPNGGGEAVLGREDEDAAARRRRRSGARLRR